MADIHLKSQEDVLVAVLACERGPNGETLTGRTFDITKNLCEGMVYFDLPEGLWRIVFIIKTRFYTPEWSLMYCDPLSSDSMQVFIDNVYEPHYEHFKEYFGDTFAAFFSDEPRFGNNKGLYEARLGLRYGCYPWTDHVLSLLEEELGSDAKQLLPGLWFDTEKTAMARIRVTYMNIITKLYQRNFNEKISDWCHSHGVEYLGHIIEDNGTHTATGWTAGHFFRSMEGQDYGGIDLVLHEIIPGIIDQSTATDADYEMTDPNFFIYALGKLAASHAHLDPKKRNKAMCEIYGAYGWAEGLKTMKWLTDHMLVRGINWFVPHAFSPKFPDPDCPPHFHANGHNPQFRHFGLLMGYANRMCHLLAKGTHAAAAAILYHCESEWSGAKFKPMERVAKRLYDDQLDYDYIPSDYLERIQIINGKLCINGIQFPAFIVPYSECLPLSIIQRLNELASQGGQVIYEDGFPLFCGEGIDLSEYRAVATVVPEERMAGYLREHGAADVTLDEANRLLRVYHLRHNQGDVYFLTNENVNEPVEATISFSAFSGGQYLEYDGFDNHVVAERSDDGNIVVKLHPYESKSLIFGNKAFEESIFDEILSGIKEETDYHVFHATPASVAAVPICGPYQVSIATEEEYPVFTPYKQLSALENMTGPKHLPHFSGHMRYDTDFWLPEDSQWQVILDLGQCGETAAVELNGCDAGVKIASPYRFDISKMVRKGQNTLRVTVANHLGWAMRDHMSAFLLFEPSGLIGPVKLEMAQLNAD
jgi:hypothetical protein